MTTCRGFMKAMLAACMAPAIVRADSLMKIYVPQQEIFVPKSGLFDGSGDYLPADQFNFGEVDFTIETWAKPEIANEWPHFTMIPGPTKPEILTNYSNMLLYK